MVWIKHLAKKVLHVLKPSCSPLFSCCPQGQLFVCWGFASEFWGFFCLYFLLPSETLALCKSSQLAVIPANHLITLLTYAIPAHIHSFSISLSECMFFLLLPIFYTTNHHSCSEIAGETAEPIDKHLEN